MKKLIVGFTISLLLVIGTTAQAAYVAGNGIKGTAHDMSSAGDGKTYGNAADTLDRICIYCHTPHHAALDTEAAAGVNPLSYYPLWNHDVTQVDFTNKLYSSGLSQPTGTQHQLNAILTKPGSVSILCLSCHDGSIAVAAYGNLGGGLNPSKGNAAGAKLAATEYAIGAGGNLQNHHPIGFDYTAVAGVLDDEIRTADWGPIGNGTWNLYISDLLWNNRMECSSCHDVHNTKNEGAKFTWVEDFQSALCLTCHAK
jgi:predicted CXXCH cytochrome family protein